MNDKELLRRKKISETMKGKKPKNYYLWLKKSEEYKKEHPTNDGSFKEGEEHRSWKGEQVSYQGLHNWVKSKLVKPTFCEFCGSNKHIELSNISGLYKRDLNDWQWLCAICHRAYDKGKNSIKEKYG